MASCNDLTLSTIINSKLSANFFNPFINVVKAFRMEIRDPYINKQTGFESSGFDRYCRLMYDMMDEGECLVEDLDPNCLE